MNKNEQKEMVRHPLHYGGDVPYETIKVLRAWFGDDALKLFCEMTAVKYLSRLGKKETDKEIQDVKKAIWYLTYIVENLNDKSN